MPRGAAVRLAEGLEPGKRVVGEVVGHVLVDLPGHAGLLQPLDIAGPAVRVRMAAQLGEIVVRIGDHRAACLALGVVVAGPQEHAVRVGAGLHRAVVGIAQRERIGQGELERHVAALEVAHRMVLLGLGPVRHAPVVPCLLCIRPGVGRAFHPHVAEVRSGIQRKGGDGALSAGVGLQPQAARAVATGQRRCRGNETVTEATHARQRAEVVVERAVLLHEHHDVLQVLQAARARSRGDRCCPGDAGQQRRKAGGDAGLQQSASAGISHRVTLTGPRGRRCRRCAGRR